MFSSTLAAYVVLSFVFPQVIPRARFLPPPESHTWPHICNGHEGAGHTTQTWERGTLFWDSVQWDTAESCINA